MKDIIQFSHANGFPASCYRTLFKSLEDSFEIQYIDTLGHNPLFPVTDNWASLVDELVYFLDKNFKEPVIGVGHSLGGAISFFAAIKRPDLFKALVLLDSPLFSFAKGKIIQFLKKIGKVRWVTPGDRAERRRTHFPSIEAAKTYFESRPLFNRFSKECIQDFAEFGTCPHNQERVLKFNPKIEAEIYRTLPHNFYHYKNQLTIPCYAIIGRLSHILHAHDKWSMKKYFNIQILEVEGDHLFPFEFPRQTANAIKFAVHELLHKSKE